jgi:LmbE family N-acetylglucosaminyl deacetylase
MTVQRCGLAAAVAIAAGYLSAGAQQRSAQYRVEPLSDLQGTPALTLMLRQLGTAGTLMQTTAHPDDENNAMLALHARRMGIRVALVSATRGDGGQNEIGPELFDALGILRTEELLAAHRWDGAEQYFTRAVDFGYSFSPEETIAKWGREEIVGDLVRLIRTIRPDVITSLGVGGAGGGQHHQASAILTREAYARAGDLSQFPGQIAGGLKPWQPKKLYQPAARGAAADGPFAVVDANLYEPLLGCTIAEIGSIAFGMHMCQGRAPVVGGAGAAASRYRLVETTLPSQTNASERSLFDGIDTSLAGLAAFAGGRPPHELTSGLAAIASRVGAATRALGAGGPGAAVPELLAGLTAVRTLRGALGGMALAESARDEIDLRLKRKEQQFAQAVPIAHAMRIDALARDGLIVAGQTVPVSLLVANRGEADVTVHRVTFAGFEEGKACAPGRPTIATPYACDVELTVPDDARITGPYWERAESATLATLAPDAPFGLPFRPTPFVATIELEVAGTPVTHEIPVRFRYEGAGLVGEKRMELKVVPAFNVRVSPAIVVMPVGAAAGADRRREIRVTVQNQTRGEASGTVSLSLPEGWAATPASAPVSFTREDESMTVRFRISPRAGVEPGAFTVKAALTGGSSRSVAGPAGVVRAHRERFDRGYQVIEYPHTERRHKTVAAEARVKVIDVSVAPGLRVGYVMGVGDQVPAAIEQLGVGVQFIGEDELAYGNLAGYDTIVLGVRAYERRADLRANNARLLEYVEHGGTLIVQYNKMEFNQAQYGPYPAIVSSSRVTDETAPVTILEKAHTAFTFPNRLGANAWDGWVQERGLYFLGERDARYADLVTMEDPFPFNPGKKAGAMVEARYGKGRWIYLGLGLWRQLPAGTPGAYQLLANLLSLGKAPTGQGIKP